MIRRRYLGGLASGALSTIAGCSGDGDSDNNQDQVNDTDMNASTGEPAQQRDIDVVIDSAEWGDESSVELFVDNNGQDRSGSIALTAKWFDEAGNFLGYDTFGLRTLGGGETWWFWFEPSIDWHPVEEFELFMDYDPGGLTTPGDVGLREGELGDDLVFRGIVENDRSQQSSLEVIIPIYGENGRLLYAYSTSQDGIPADTDWRFRNLIQGYERDEIEDYEVLLHDPNSG